MITDRHSQCRRMVGWMDGWMGGRAGGWVDG